MLTQQGPMPDIQALCPLLDQCVPSICIHHLLADAGYDSEPNHTYARDEHGIITTIPARAGRQSSKPPNGKYRRLMTQGFEHRPYGQRWQVETVFSMIKRNQGTVVAARTYHARNREMRLAVLTHNIMVLWTIGLFYRACREPFFTSTLEGVTSYEFVLVTGRKTSVFFANTRGVYNYDEIGRLAAVSTQMLEGINMPTLQTTTYHYTIVICWQSSSQGVLWTCCYKYC